MVSTKKKSEDKVEKKSDTLDVSSLLENFEEKPIVPVQGKPLVLKKETIEKVPAPTSKSFVPQDKSFGSQDKPVEDRLKEDLKMSYPAKGILDITFGGYGFLRQDYILNPDRDIYVSTSQIRRFWLRRGDGVEGLARPPKEGERFHSLLLIKKINGEELTEEQSRMRNQFDQLTSLHPNEQIKLETEKHILSTRIMDLL